MAARRAGAPERSVPSSSSYQDLEISMATSPFLYQPSQRVTDDRPIAVGDGHDVPGLIDEGVPGIAAVIDDVVEGFEDAVRQPVLAHELPDIFLAVELGRARRQRQERDVARHLEVLGAVPAGLIEDDNRVGTRGDLGADLVEMKL